MNSTFTPLMLAELSGLDSSGALVLTVNNRYARRILADLSAGLNEQRQVMALPEILPISAWFQQMAGQLAFMQGSGLPSHALDAFGAQCLWQRVIEAIETDEVLLDVGQAARLAIEADRLISEWDLVVHEHEQTSDYQRFQMWRDAYHDALKALDADDGNQSFDRVCASLIEGRLDLPFHTIVLAGFNEISPRLGAVLDSLVQRGVVLKALQHAQRPARSTQRVKAPDPDQEWRLAAQWAATRLQANPKGRYAIVASSLEGSVVLAHRVLREALSGEGTATAMPYNMAVARPLSDWPAVRAGLAWLTVLAELTIHKRCEPRAAGAALLAGHCQGGALEASGRAQIDAHWRAHAVVVVSAGGFAQQLSRFTPSLAHAWAQCFDDAVGDSQAATIDVWVARIRRWLQLLGYPGPTALDSHGYQVMEAFDRLLVRLEQQYVVLGRIGFVGAVAMLRRLANHTMFQPQRDPAARLDILGFLEAEGGRWDGAWLLGLTDDVLPAAPKPNPLIPMATLRRANAPRATPDRELSWAQSLFTSLMGIADDIIVSHALRDGETERRPSPCIMAIEAVDEAPVARPPLEARREYLLDDRGPPLPAGATTHGGLGVIDTQARNPLWAFVKYRLGAKRMSDYAELADQNARGIFLHRCMEHVWTALDGQEALRRSVDAGQLDALIHDAVATASQECLQDYGDVLQSLEQERAQRVLHEWLLLELKREPFSIHAVEQTMQWRYQSLELSVRLDRIDQLNDGRLAVLDYKTGAGKLDPKPDWMRERPIGLQLPFYASVLAAADTPVAALVIARLHAREVAVKGLADGDYGFGGLASVADWPMFAGGSWGDLMARWRDTIAKLASEYVQGHAANSSLRAGDLDYCDVLPFLRLEQWPLHQEHDNVDD